jgi:hypothetical protein
MVDLPAPDGPTRATRCPRGTENERRRRCGRSGASCGRERRARSRSTAASASSPLLEQLLRLRLVGGFRVGEVDAIEGDGVGGASASSAGTAVTAASASISLGVSMISWMRPSAPSAWFTEVTAPNAWPSGMIIMNRNRMKARARRSSMSPAATRKPPTPSTVRNETCMAMPAIGTTSAEILATRMPAEIPGPRPPRR